MSSATSQVKSKSSQRFLLQQNKYHTYINIRDWNPFGFICLLKYIHYSYRTWPHFGDNRVSTGASTEVKRSPKGTGRPPQVALDSFHAENLQYSPWQQGRPHDDSHVPVHNNDAKHLGVKIPQQENMPHVYQCSLCSYSSVYVIPTHYRFDKMADMLQMTFSLTQVFLFCFKVQ